MEMKEDGEAGGGGGKRSDRRHEQRQREKKVTIVKLSFEMNKAKRMRKMMVIMMMK